MVALPESHYAAGVIVRRTKKGYRFLVIDTEKLEGPEAGLRLTQFAGGMDEVFDNGNPEKTLQEEIFEETGLLINREADLKLLLQLESEGHYKFFFQILRRDCTGTIRTIEINDKRKKLYIPRWVDRETLDRIICHSHRPVLEFLPR